MKTVPKLSVLTLTRNRAELLRQHLASLVGQTKPGDELIIIDNGSTDHTQAVIAAYAGTLPIRTFVTRVKGYPKLYNFAIKKAKNPILVFFDDDCIADPGFLAGHRQAHRDGNRHIVQGQSYSIPAGNIYAEIMGDHYQNWLTMYMTRDGKMRTFDNKNVSLPASLLSEYGAFSPRLEAGGEDIELGFRMSGHGVPIVFAPHVTARHYERDTFRTFIQQHLRFARSDAYLARHMHQDTSLTLFVGYKIYLHTKSALRREFGYLLRGNFRDALRLPFLYCALFFLRIWGYAISR